MRGADMQVKAFFDSRTSTLTYVIYDSDSRDALVIDPVLDYNTSASEIYTESLDEVIGFIREQRLMPLMILETHAHADHLSGAQVLKEHYPSAQIGVGNKISLVQETFKEFFDLPVDFPTDGSQFDRLFDDREIVRAGSLQFEVIFTPGHTPACTTFRFDDAIFTGDTMFMPDFGTGRCDFPAGSAGDLYDSITTRLFCLPDETRVFVGHDYQPGGRALQYETTIGEQKRHNIQLPEGRSRAEFVTFRTERDRKLDTPRLLFQSVQVNVDAGSLPKPAENEVRYLKIPVNIFKPKIAPQDGLEEQAVNPQNADS
jgi:glyoxylase-like metal-dependent hydrolase (beta-lactamase superfamily II)